MLDTAHNPASARALVETLAELPAAARRTLILSISHDKDVPAIVRELAPHFDRIIVTQYQENPRAVPADELAEIVRGRSRCQPRIDVVSAPRRSEAWQFAIESAVPGECICIAGSFYLAAEMRPLIQRQRPRLRSRWPGSDRTRDCSVRSITNFVLQILDQLSNVRIGPRQHIASDRAARHASTVCNSETAITVQRTRLKATMDFRPPTSRDKICDKVVRPLDPHAVLALTRSARGEP